jgi:hypothetical protein
MRPFTSNKHQESKRAYKGTICKMNQKFIVDLENYVYRKDGESTGIETDYVGTPKTTDRGKLDRSQSMKKKTGMRLPKRHGPLDRPLNAHNKCSGGHVCNGHISLAPASTRSKSSPGKD